MNELKARYRNKVGKIIIEVWNGEKWLYVKTLSNPLIEFKAECLQKVSCFKPNNVQKEPQKYVQSPLTEPIEKDTPPKKVNINDLIPTAEQLKKLLDYNN